jgi:predicted RNA polymerase sigma factor
MLLGLTDSPVVALNHAIATAMVHGPNAGLALLEPLESDARLATSHRLDAVRGHLLERSGETAAAVELYRKAASRTTSVTDRNNHHKKAARHEEPATGLCAATNCQRSGGPSGLCNNRTRARDDIHAIHGAA